MFVGVSEATKIDGRVQRGDQTRRAILGRAVDIASVEGLEGISIGRLASELKQSKSGVFAHFGSKEELQLATIRAASRIYFDNVVVPARETPPGIARVWALWQSKRAYLERPVFPGGCFFQTVEAEFDARPGRVRDAIAKAREDWMRLYLDTIADAIQLGEIQADVDPEQLCFELDAFARAANSDALLHGDQSGFARAQNAALARLRSVATDAAAMLDA